MKLHRRTMLGQARPALPGEINHEAIDRFTAGHAAVGVILGLVRAPWWLAIPFAIGWEIVERPLKDHVPALFPRATQDSLANSTVDAIAMIAGWGAMMAFPRNTP